MPRFSGWPEDFQRFFIGLELDNSKRYFEANRRTYDESVRAPMVALMESLEDEHGPAKVFRANRDIRFSKDKSPYKTNIAAHNGKAGVGGYLSLDKKGLTVAVGCYELTPAQLATYRKRVAAEASGAALASIVGRLEKAGYKMGGEQLKRVPAGSPPGPSVEAQACLCLSGLWPPAVAGLGRRTGQGGQGLRRCRASFRLAEEIRTLGAFHSLRLQRDLTPRASFGGR
jgi:uncharacterized protein (TIGR02453 family)